MKAVGDGGLQAMVFACRLIRFYLAPWRLASDDSLDASATETMLPRAPVLEGIFLRILFFLLAFPTSYFAASC